MRFVYATLALALASSIHALPFEKRINQVIADSLTDWEQACDTAGGGQQCNALKVQAFGTLLAGADVCGQQNFADQMIDLAKTLQNNADMIRLTQIFRQQPRNAPDSLSVLYCQDTPKNEELVGYFQCQFQGVNDNVFTGNVAAGQPGTLPPGVSSLPTPGSCPANLGGKIADGVQLVTLVSDPGAPFTGGNTGGNNNGNTGGGSQSPVQAAPPADTTSATDDATSSAEAAPPAATPPASNPGGFQLANAQQAQQQNRDFANLTADSPCQDGQIACIGDAFAQCANGKFAVTSCAASTKCAALPLVNSVGTSVTCDTDADIALRFAAAGANGGIDGQQ